MTLHSPPFRICVVGAESTGKTTLCSDLAAAWGVPFVPEFGRWYTEAMPDPSQYTWTSADFLTIAEVQHRLEDDAARWVGDLVICDTGAYTTALFHEAYMGEPSAELDALGARDAERYDLIVVCDIDTPFQQDATTGLRREGPQRAWMHERYLQLVQPLGTRGRGIVVRGTPESRVRCVLEHLSCHHGLSPAPATKH
jgi:HTH-type transcriptional repressor of NAD biosynthesis genes